LDSYFVRIYRHGTRTAPARRSHDAIALTGVVENAASGEHRTFHDIEELWAILAAKKAPAPGMTDEENQPL
jgi:hypothetical protein